MKKSELRFETLLRATRFRHFAIFSIFCRFIGIKSSKYTEDASALQTPVIPIKTRFLLRIPHISTNVRFLVNLSFWLVFFVSCFNGFCAYIWVRANYNAINFLRHRLSDAPQPPIQCLFSLEKRILNDLLFRVNLDNVFVWFFMILSNDNRFISILIQRHLLLFWTRRYPPLFSPQKRCFLLRFKSPRSALPDQIINILNK